MTPEPADAPPADPLTVLVDDTRDFKDGRTSLTARTSAEAVALLESLRDRTIQTLWLDYDLGDGDTAQPVVDHLLDLARAGTPQPVESVRVHSSNIWHGRRVLDALVAAGYPAVRDFGAGRFVRRRQRAM